MDHCQNASEPEPTEGPVEVLEPLDPEPREPEPRKSALPDPDAASGARTERDGSRVPVRPARALDAWADQVRQRHLQKALTALEARTDLTEDDRAAVAACSRAIVDEVLCRPRSELRSRAEGSGSGTARDALALFDLADD